MPRYLDAMYFLVFLSIIILLLKVVVPVVVPQAIYKFSFSVFFPTIGVISIYIVFPPIPV